MAPVDRQYPYGSLDRKIYDQYLELFADFKYVRAFLGRRAGRRARLRLTYSRMQLILRMQHINGSSDGISVPIQNPFNPFTVAGLHFTREDLTQDTLTPKSVLRLREPGSRPACITRFGSGAAYRRDYNP